MRLKRKDPYLDEAIEVLDGYFDRAGHDLRRAYSLLTSFEQSFINSEIERAMRDFRYYAENYHVIPTEGEGLAVIQFWDSQEIIDATIEDEIKKTGKAKIIILKARQLGLCLDPKTRVLTTDLKWIPIEEVLPGQELVSVDEGQTFEEWKKSHTSRAKDWESSRETGVPKKVIPRNERQKARKMRSAFVVDKREVFESAFRIKMDNGEVLTATGQHRFLCKQRGGSCAIWRTVQTMQVGDDIRYVTKPWGESEYEDGWFGGFLDGKGTVRAKHSGGVEACVAQVSNKALIRATDYLNSRQYNLRVEVDSRKGGESSKLGNKPVTKLVLNRMNEIFRLIGQTRPSRFIGQKWWEGKDLPGKNSGQAWSKIISIEALPAQRMIDIQTTTKTFIAEGFVSHNSTYSEARLFHKTIFTEACNSLVVAQDPDQVDYLFNMSRTAYECLPWWMRPEARYEAKGAYLIFDRKREGDRLTNPGLRSQVLCQAANKACLCPGVQVLTTRGLIPIESIVPGDFVFGPNCKPVKVVAALRKLAPSKIGRKIVAWHNAAFPISGTSDHPLITLDGLKGMEEIKKGDRLKIPFRKIVSGGDIPNPRMSKHAYVRLKHRPSPKPNRDWGFLCGLYLAEGSIEKWNGSTVSFTLSIFEDHLAERVSKACGISLAPPMVCRGRKTHRLHSSWVGTWLRQEFGCGDDKKVPDWVFGCGVEFCLGLLEGMVLGDGHKCKTRNDIVLVTVRPLLAIQFRELALSLGFGLGGIMKTKTSWKWNGVKKTGVGYRVEWGGDVAISIRHALGFKLNPVNKVLRNRKKWGWIENRNEVWVEVKFVEPCVIDEVYDIQVDSEDHLYLLPASITHNTGVGVGKTLRCVHLSEISLWDDPDVLTKHIFPTMNAPDVLGIMESTARGRNNAWHHLWIGAMEGHVDWRPLFIESYRVKKYFVPIPAGEKFELTTQEQGIHDRILREKDVDIPDGHFFWRRKKIQESIAVNHNPWAFFQEYPSVDWMEAFQGSGITAFNKERLYEILQGQCCDPIWFGEINLTSSGVPNIRLQLTKDADFLPAAEGPGARLLVWEQPQEGEKYYQAADVALGAEGGDFSSIYILKIGKGVEPDEFVAEWHGWINPTPLGDVAVALAKWYNGCQIAVECNGPGLTTNSHIFREIGYYNLFRWKHYDKIKNFMTDLLGWWTNVKTRDTLITKFSEALDDRAIIIRSKWLIDECLDFSADEGSSKFEGQGNHDDRIFAAMICLFCAHDSDYGRKAAMEKRGDKVTEEERRKKDRFNTDYSPIHDQPNSVRGSLHYNHDIPPEVIMYSDLSGTEGNPSGDETTNDDWKCF